MSRTGAHAQWKTSGASTAAFARGYLVEGDAPGCYRLSETGPAAAILTDTGDGTLRIATTGTEAGRIYTPAGQANFRISR